LRLTSVNARGTVTTNWPLVDYTCYSIMPKYKDDGLGYYLLSRGWIRLQETPSQGNPQAFHRERYR